MNYDIVFASSFRRGIRKLKKRFPSVRKDVGLAIEILLENPELTPNRFIQSWQLTGMLTELS